MKKTKNVDELLAKIAMDGDVPVPGPDFDERVLRAARVRALAAAPRTGGLFQWFKSPFAVAGWAAAGAWVLVLFAVLVSRWSPLHTEPGNVAFQLAYPTARTVSVVGDFTKWEPVALQGFDGVWRGRFSLPPGVYQYQFIVDGGIWMPDPAAAAGVEDDFGRANSLLHVAVEQSL